MAEGELTFANERPVEINGLSCEEIDGDVVLLDLGLPESTGQPDSTNSVGLDPLGRLTEATEFVSIIVLT